MKRFHPVITTYESGIGENQEAEMAQCAEGDYVDVKVAQELQLALRCALDYIDAIPKEIQFPVMPGFDRDWAERVQRGEEE